MPIVKLTKGVNLGPGLPELGRLRKGGPKQKKVKNGKEYEVYGKELDHWRVDFTNPQATPEWAEIFADLYGHEPKIITGVQFLSASIEDIFPNYYEDIRNGIVMTRCDGELRTKHWTGEGFSKIPVPCLRDSAQPCECTAKARLYFWLPEFCARLGMPGTFVLSTQSVTDIRHIFEALTNYQNNGVPLNRVAFVLARKPGQVPFATSDGKPAMSQHFFVELTLDKEYMLALNDLVSRQMLQPGGGGGLQIGPGTSQEAELVDLGVDEPIIDEGEEDYIDAEEMPEHDPSYWILPKADKKLTKAAVERIQDRAKGHGVKSKEDLFLLLGIGDFGWDSFPFDEEVAMEALATGTMAWEMELQPAEVAQIIGADLQYIWGYCFNHGDEVRAALKAWAGVEE